jgi:hypothetical protein
MQSKILTYFADSRAWQSHISPILQTHLLSRVTYLEDSLACPLIQNKKLTYFADSQAWQSHLSPILQTHLLSRVTYLEDSFAWPLGFPMWQITHPADSLAWQSHIPRRLIRLASWPSFMTNHQSCRLTFLAESHIRKTHTPWPLDSPKWEITYPADSLAWQSHIPRRLIRVASCLPY